MPNGAEDDTQAANAAARQYDWRPRPDPTVLTTQQLRETEAAITARFHESLAAQRELLEQRLDGMDKATELLAEQVTKIPVDSSTARIHVRDEFAAADLALRELLTGRIDGMDPATRLLADGVAKIPSDIDREVKNIREVLTGLIRGVQDVSIEKFLAIDGTFASNALALTAALAAQKEAAAEQNKSNTLAITKSEQATKETIASNAQQTATSLKSLADRLDDLKERVDRGEGSTSGSADTRSDQRLNISQVIAAIATLAAVLGFILYAVKR